MTEQTDTSVQGTTATMTDLAQRLYDAVLSGDFETALHHCQKEGARETIHSAILQTIEQLDNDWQHDRVGLEVLANSFWTTRRVLEQIRSAGAGHRAIGQTPSTALLSVPAGEEHSFGAQLLADRLERMDWCVDVLFEATSNVLLEQVSSQKYDILGFSIGCDHNLLGLADIITEARIESLSPNLKIIVGGSAFREPLDQYDFLGADAVSGHPDSALDPFFSVRSARIPNED